MNQGMIRGAIWNVLLRIADRAIGLLSTIVLARLLVPADFGLVALATSLIALLALLGAFGLDLALIQKADADRRFFDTVWTYNVLFGFALAGVLALLAAPAARFYGEPRLEHVIFALAIARAIAGFENVGVIAFRKEMAFDQEFRFLLYRRLATTFLATLPLAFLWRSYWALVGGTIIGSCYGVVLSYILHPYRPRPSLGAVRELFGFSKWLQFAHIVGFASGRATDFIIGKAAGISALGSFNIAREIANLPSAELAMPVHRGIFPGYARISNDLGALKRAYLKVASVLVLITLPAGIGLGLVAQPVVQVFLGEKWNDAVPLIQILAVNGVISVFLSTAAYVYLALGTTHRTATLTVVHVCVSLPAMLLLVPPVGVRGAAFSLLLGTLATMPVNFRMMAGAISLTLPDIGRIIWRPLMATVVMIGAVMLAGHYWMTAKTFAGNVANLMVTAGIGATAYCVALTLLWRVAGRPEGAETFVLERSKVVAAACRNRVRLWWNQ